MNELVMQMRWTRAAQILFMATALSGSAACNMISGANGITFEEPNIEGNGDGGGGSGLSGDMMNNSGPTSSTGGESGANNLSSGSGGPAQGTAINASGQALCNDKDVMVAVNGRYGSWIDSVGVMCAKINGDGTMGIPYRSPVFGGPNGTKTYTVGCKPGQVVVELNYKVYANTLYMFSVGCATFSNGKSSGVVSYTSPYQGTSRTDAEEKHLEPCNPGEVAAGLDVSVEAGRVTNLGPLHCVPAP